MSSTKQDWTPEPWNYWNETGQDRDGEPSSTFNIQSSDGDIIAICDDGWARHEPDTDNVGNARRIVACVNALAGIPDPAAYIKAMREVCEAAKSLHWDEDFVRLHKALEALRTLATPESEVKRGSSQADADGKEGEKP